jgi:hypothetical protein
MNSREKIFDLSVALEELDEICQAVATILEIR